MKEIVIFAERILPSTQTYIPLQVNALTRYRAHYAGLIPAEQNLPLREQPILLTAKRNTHSRIRREFYRWTGWAPGFHRLLRLRNPVLIHAHFAEGASAATSLGKTLDIPLLLHLRGGGELVPDSELRRHLYQLPYLAYRRRLWREATFFLCVSDYIRRRAILAGYPEDKLIVHYTGMDCTLFCPSKGVKRDRHLVVYVGRLVKSKGLDYLLRAMAIVQQQLPHAHLVLIGDGEMRRELGALSHALNLNCRFVGEQKQADILPWLAQARVFCGPSITLDDGTSEAFGNVFCEAQAMGVPVVSFRTGGIPETMVEGVTGLLANERDVPTLASHIARYLRDDGFWASSSQAATAWVRQTFDVKRQTARLETLYDQAIEEYSRRRPGRSPFATPHEATRGC